MTLTQELPLTVQEPPLVLAEGGEVVRVAGTRIPLETVVGEYLGGMTAENIVENYTTLRLADVYAVLSFYLNNRQAVDTYIAQQNERAEAIRQQIETDPRTIAAKHQLRSRRDRNAVTMVDK